MSRPCQKCPCPASCLRWPLFCEWAAEDPPDPIKLKHICGRSAMPAGPLAYPSLAQRATRLGRELWDWFAAGLPLSRETSRRLAICEACEHFTASRQCDLCTCHMDLKARLATAHCPIDKW